ncbi:hypothetical protein QQ045_005309 [Rhodiola kirilowii]
MFNKDGIGSSGVEERRRMTRKQHRTMSKAKSESEDVDRKTKYHEAMNTGECLNSAASGEGCEAGEEAMNTGECFNSASSGEGCEAKKEAMNTGECFNSASSGEGCEAKKVSTEEGELSNTERAFGKIVASEEFGDLRGLICRCFGGFELEGLNDYRLIDERVKEGAYEQKPSLFASDLDKFLNKIQKLGADISTLARSLSDKTETSYQQNSTVVDMLAVFDTFKVYEDKKPRIKKEPQPVKLHAPVNLSAPLPPQPPPPHQDLYLDFAGGASSLVLTGCQQCHMYVMTLPGNNKCPNCFERNLKEFRTLEREAAKRDAARRIRLDLSL